jgi:hypothetical protein
MDTRTSEIRAETIRARRLIIEGDDGATSASLEVATQADGTQILRFSDKHGRTRISMEISEDDVAGLTVLDADEVPRARIVVAADGQPTMMVDRGTRIIRQTFTRER